MTKGKTGKLAKYHNQDKIYSQLLKPDTGALVVRPHETTLNCRYWLTKYLLRPVRMLFVSADQDDKPCFLTTTPLLQWIVNIGSFQISSTKNLIFQKQLLSTAVSFAAKIHKHLLLAVLMPFVIYFSVSNPVFTIPYQLQHSSYWSIHGEEREACKCKFDCVVVIQVDTSVSATKPATRAADDGGGGCPKMLSGWSINQWKTLHFIKIF